MSPKQELAVGLAVWFVGTAVILGVALATPRFESEGYTIGGAFVLLGLVLIWTAACDLLLDNWEEEIEESYNE